MMCWVWPVPYAFEPNAGAGWLKLEKSGKTNNSVHVCAMLEFIPQLTKMKKFHRISRE